MNWTKAVIAGVVGGIVVNIYAFLVHGFIMRATYEKYEVFGVAPAPSPVWFFVVAIVVGIFGAIVFAKSRSAWGAGVKGGVNFGFWFGLVAFFAQFYNPLVIKGFPYFLSWCWGGITLIGWLIFGAIASLL
ncbi:MAG: hypothetical protein ACE5HI_07635, partial [bacterium]